MIFLLDTNILSEPLKPKSDPKVVEALLNNIGNMGTATPVIYEMIYGAKRLPESKRRTEILRYPQPCISDNHTYPSMPLYIQLYSFGIMSFHHCLHNQ
ncbi:PIN domain-containing protein [Candidatus Albibeggiatoa sp. nov. NOAA]|uniref:PIN domain-containing protein n=1 Tax=Candidatus Albibeggiatoa sp. nov. NOAA TaxID=3162724 RepID=UPI00333F819B